MAQVKLSYTTGTRYNMDPVNKEGFLFGLIFTVHTSCGLEDPRTVSLREATVGWGF